MTTKSLASKPLRFSKIIIALAILGLGFGLDSASAALLTAAQAKAAAAQISAVKQYNAAFNVARDITANTGAEYAALNARLIAKYLDGNNLGLLTAIINGVSYNYPGQQAAIVTQIILLNENTRNRAANIVGLLGSSLSSDAASQLAATLNYRLLKDGYTRKKAGVLAYTILSAVNNSATGTPEERANAMAIAAANLAANLLTPNRHGTVPKDDLKAFTQITYVLASYAQTADTGALTRQELINNMVGYFASTLKASTTAGTMSSAMALNTLNRTRALLLALLPSYASTINAVIQQVINDPGAFGPIVPPETPH